MYRIEKLTAHPKDSSKFYIHLQDTEGNKSAFPVHEDIIIKFGIRKDLELPLSEVEAIQKEGDLWKIYIHAIHYLSYRMRTREELRRYLLKKEFDMAAVDHVLIRLEDEKHLDDDAFAEAFVRTRMKLSTKGPLLVTKEMKELGLNKGVIDKALALYSKETQLENAEKYLSKKNVSSSSKRSNREQQQRSVSLLLQRGFSHEVAQVTLQNNKEETDEDDEWNAVQYQGDKALRKYQKLDQRKKNYKIKQYLFRKGFQTDVIQRYIDFNNKE